MLEVRLGGGGGEDRAETRGRGVSTVLGVVFLVGLAIVGAAVVGGYSLGLLDDVLGTDVPQAAYEFDYDADRGLLTVTQTSGRTFEDEDLDSLRVRVTDGGGTETFAWRDAVGAGGQVSAGSSLRIDDAYGTDVGAFTIDGAFGEGETVKVLFVGQSQSYPLASYRLPSRSIASVTWRVPTDGLVNRYALDDGVSVTDEVGDADGQAIGVTRGVGGQVGSAYGFDGDDHVAVDRSFDGSGAIDAMSACAWFRTSEDDTGEFSNWALLDFDRSEYFNLYVRGDTGGVGFSTSGPSQETVDNSTQGNYADGDWHLACATYNASTNHKRIYVNDSLVKQAQAENKNGLGTGTERWGFIGDGSEASSFDGDRNEQYFDGRIDEVRLYEEALTASEVDDLYDAGRGSASAPTSGLTNYWALDESASANTVRDGVGSGDGTLVGPTDRGLNGPVGSAYGFVDDSGYVALDRSFASTDIGNVTTCAWFRTSETGDPDNWALLDFDRSEYFNLYVQGDGRVGWSTSAESGYTGSTVDDQFTDGGGYNDDSWHHACGVYDGDKRILVDGGVEASTADPHAGGTLGSGATRYGVVGDGSEADDYGQLTSASATGQRNEYYYDGAVDDIRLYGRGLSTEEAERLWAFTGGAQTASYETATRELPEPVNVDTLEVQAIDARIPDGTGISVEVRVDTDGDGALDETSDTLTLDGSGPQSVTGLSGETSRVALVVTYTGGADVAESPTVDGFDLLVG
jgi:hypothetical protein